MLIDKNKERKIADFVARWYLRYNRGKSLAGVIIDLVQWLAYISIIFVAWNVPKDRFAISLPFVVLGLAFFGLFDEEKGFWKAQNRRESEYLNPKIQEMADEIKKIKEKLNA